MKLLTVIIQNKAEMPNYCTFAFGNVACFWHVTAIVF